MSTRGLRNGAIASFVIALSFLIVGGFYANNRIAPIPRQVVAEGGGNALTDREAIMRGQGVWQRYGLMDHGSIWGHGSLRGPDFSAHTLHRMGQYMREYYQPARAEFRSNKLNVRPEQIVDVAVINEIKANKYDPKTEVLTLTAAQADAFGRLRAYWNDLFTSGSAEYGFLPQTVPTPAERQDIADFFFWTAWAAGANRPGLTYSYTNNWPPDRSVGNTPTIEAYIWSIAGLVTLLVVLGTVIYIVHRYQFFYGPARAVDAADRLLTLPLTPSQRASAKFFLIAGLLFVVQILNGGLLAHYTVHPGSFYIQKIGKIYAYSWAKSWHLQLAIFWIAISWIGTAIFVAPLIAEREPKGQRALVNILFVATFLVVVGSLTGEVLSIKGYMPGTLWFWLGHQGWEYLELGRLWQILLFGGLIFWLVIVYRAMATVVQARSEVQADRKSLILFYIISAILVVAFFGFGLFYGRGTHFTVADYWRWFVVHIWVEGMFEFFAAASGALLLTALGLVSRASALRAAYLTAILVFASGIIGTSHHYFWFGAPGFWMALGAVFSSLEPVPLILLASRGWAEYKTIADAGEKFPYRWPLMFLIASAFWNFLGAGVFGFMINLPIINYYEHGTYLTANHAHTALFGTYGMLAIALSLFVWRGLVRPERWNDRLLKVSFWGLNLGLAAMSFLTLLPVGILEMVRCYSRGLWAAKSNEFFSQPIIQTLGQIRIIPDTMIILFGAVPLALFLITSVRNLKRAEVPEGGAIFAGEEPATPL